MARIPHPSGGRKGVVRFLRSFTGRCGVTVGGSTMNGVLVSGPTAPNGRGLPAIILRSRVSVIYRGGGKATRSFSRSPVRAVISKG